MLRTELSVLVSYRTPVRGVGIETKMVVVKCLSLLIALFVSVGIETSSVTLFSLLALIAHLL
ncbi:hypothetical protein DXA92_13130 [Agathobaculum butyriciproducens]|nr:hypothetical protein DXA94_03960 [Agathobaculum butyriciproducens]RGC58904.1 hypothetical protein DXA92_13130 [Agathobaculum butyriciproducens]